MNLKQLRSERGWSQEHLAQISGVSVRTLQRIEGGATAGHETARALAAAFDTDVATLRMTGRARATPEHVAQLRGLHANLISAVVILPCLLLFNLVITPDSLWIWYVVAGWGLGLAVHWALLRFVYRSDYDGDLMSKRR